MQILSATESFQRFWSHAKTDKIETSLIDLYSTINKLVIASSSFVKKTSTTIANYKFIFLLFRLQFPPLVDFYAGQYYKTFLNLLQESYHYKSIEWRRKPSLFYYNKGQYWKEIYD